MSVKRFMRIVSTARVLVNGYDNNTDTIESTMIYRNPEGYREGPVYAEAILKLFPNSFFDLI